MKKDIQNFKPIKILQSLNLIAVIITILLIVPKLSLAQIEQGNFEFEGVNRTYMVFLPENYSGTTDFPLVIFLHPYGFTAQQGMDYSNFNQVADTADFLVVYPNAIPNWNSGIGENPDWPAPDVNDVGFIDALIDTLNYQYSIDLEKVYVCGFSNGGFMSYRLACELGHRFAAIASVAGVISMNQAANCEPSNTMPVLHIHGTEDAVVPINGGATGWHSVDETLSFWIDYNNCMEVDTITLPDIDPTDGCTVEKISYTNCTDNSNVIYYKVINGGHTWPGAGESGLQLGNTNQDINASTEIWNFFKNYPENSCLPEGITFTTQEEIDNFQINYPGCTEIEGWVEIGHWEGSDITNLNGLSGLTSIGSYLMIGYGGPGGGPVLSNPNLTNIDGLENLSFVGGHLIIASNHLLSNLSPLNNLIHVDGLAVEHNNAITTLPDLGNLTALSGSLCVRNNPNLDNLSGLENVIFIAGNVGIGNNALTDLSGLSNLISIGESLEIDSTSFLSSLSGIENLTSVGSNLVISDNQSLNNLSGFESLTSVGDDLRILNNQSLNNLSGLESLTSVGEDLIISNNQLLTELSGIEKLETIDGDLQIEYNDSLTDLTALNELYSIGGYLRIRYNEALLNLFGLSGINSVGEDVKISNNENLIGLFGLNNLTTIGNSLTISMNNSMASLIGLNSLTSIGTNLTIEDNPSLTNFDAFSDLEYVGSNVIIKKNDAITSLSGLDNLDFVGDGLQIIENELLVDLDGLGSLNSIGGSLWIDVNPSLTSLSGLESLSSIEQYFYIVNNSSLKNLAGLESLISIGGRLTIAHNDSLFNFTGLDNLITIGESLKIDSNSVLVNLSGLNNLTTIGEDLFIRENEFLTSLTGLDSLQYIGQDLYISENSLLSECDIHSICLYLSNPSGNVNIDDNATGCENQAQVEAACEENSVAEINTDHEFEISPNPNSGLINLRFVISEKGIVTCDLLNISGIKVKSLVNEIKTSGIYEMEIDLRDIPDGVYFCVLKTSKGIQTKKIVKL